MNMVIKMDADSLKNKLARWAAVREPYLIDAGSKSLDVVQNNAVNYMFSTFKAPTGNLEETWTQTTTPQPDGVGAKLENYAPYAWRRNDGFDGPDTLGRVYHDKGIHYMEKGLSKSKKNIRALFSDALDQSVKAL